MPVFIKDFARKQYTSESIKKRVEKERREAQKARWAREEERNKEACEKIQKIQYDPSKDDLQKQLEKK